MCAVKMKKMRTPLCFILLAAFCINYTLAKRTEAQLIFTAANTSFDRAYVSSYEVKILPKAPGLSLDMRMHINSNLTLENMLSINVTRKDSSGAYRSIFVFDIDVCRLFGDDKPKSVLNMNMATLLNIWTNNIRKYGNMLSCPVLQGNYFLHNLKADKKSIPAFVQTGKYRVETMGYFKSTEPRVTYFTNILNMDIKRH